jgi:hypothetical protein
MKRNYIFFLLFLVQSFFVCAQVGINNATPAATLDVVGDVYVRQSLFLENPGTYVNSPTSNLLMFNNTTGDVAKYDMAGSTFGPLNYVQFAFLNTSSFGLDGGYDTKIDATKYTVAIQGYSFDRNGNTNVVQRSLTSSANVEGYQFYAYENAGTWWIKAFVNNSQFYIGGSVTNVDIYIDLIIYRNNFITKIWDTPLTIDMGGSDTATAPLPAGF